MFYEKCFTQPGGPNNNIPFGIVTCIFSYSSDYGASITSTWSWFLNLAFLALKPFSFATELYSSCRIYPLFEFEFVSISSTHNYFAFSAFINSSTVNLTSVSVCNAFLIILIISLSKSIISSVTFGNFYFFFSFFHNFIFHSVCLPLNLENINNPR
jgi:hypothetical protein